MRLYRVFPHDPAARAGRPGHPLFLHHGQTVGRWDNARLYATWYLSFSAAGAVGESFGNLGTWTDAMFETPFLPGAHRALGVFEVPDETPLIDLDDARVLAERDVHPSQVVIRDIAFTQPFAARVFAETDARGARRWAGIRWWSYHRPVWRNAALFDTPDAPAPVTLSAVEPLDLDHPAVREAARMLLRTL